MTRIFCSHCSSLLPLQLSFCITPKLPSKQRELVPPPFCLCCELYTLVSTSLTHPTHSSKSPLVCSCKQIISLWRWERGKLELKQECLLLLLEHTVDIIVDSFSLGLLFSIWGTEAAGMHYPCCPIYPLWVRWGNSPMEKSPWREGGEGGDILHKLRCWGTIQ